MPTMRQQLSQAVREIEKAAFLDGYYFSLGIRPCNLCNDCDVLKGEACPFPKKIRPGDQAFGIDVYKTVRTSGLPIAVLQKEHDIQNRYGFVWIDADSPRAFVSGPDFGPVKSIGKKGLFHFHGQSVRIHQPPG